MASLSKEQRADLARLFTLLIHEASRGDSWPVSTYVNSVETIVTGDRLTILLDDDDDTEAAETLRAELAGVTEEYGA